MPLDDSPWSRGKCSYKLLTYMSCGVPVVATPVGMNGDLLSRAPAGFGARTKAEWTDALERILSSPAGGAMGAAGRQLVERDYSLSALSPRMAGILTAVAAGRN